MRRFQNRKITHLIGVFFGIDRGNASERNVDVAYLFAETGLEPYAFARQFKVVRGFGVYAEYDGAVLVDEFPRHARRIVYGDEHIGRQALVFTPVDERTDDVRTGR